METEPLDIARRAGQELRARLHTCDAELLGERDGRSGVTGKSDKLAREVDAAFDQALEQLAATQLWGPANRMASNVFWEEAEGVLRRGMLQLHARCKPRGYAGDFELLEKICEREVTNDPLGKLMDHYFQDQAAPQVVRERCRVLAEQVGDKVSASRETFHVLAVGSGPAHELRSAVSLLSSRERGRLRVTLLDMDQAALDFASAKLAKFVGWDRIAASRVNLGRLAENRVLPEQLGRIDFVYCCGFFDYLEDTAAASMLQTLYGFLAPGGGLSIFNFGPANPSRAYMEWIGNWYLTYRSRPAMEQLAAELDAPARIAQVRGMLDEAAFELVVEG